MCFKQVLFYICVALLLQYKTAEASECVDRNVHCSTWKNSCSQFAVLRTYCPVTCGTCNTDSCNVSNGGCEHTCDDTFGLAVCSCRSGFQLNDDNKTCRDIDECSLGENPCGELKCQNKIGSYFCKPRDCGVVSERATPVEDMHDWPWMVQILVSGGHSCGATLLSSRWIITSNNCVHGVQHASIIIYLGHEKNALNHSLTDSPHRVYRTVNQIISHDLATRYNNSVALIKLNEAVEINEYVKPICLSGGERPQVGAKCWGTGFGFADENSVEPSNVLKEVDLPIVDIDVCRRSYTNTAYSVDRNNMMCAGYIQGGKDLCYGDMGGPLMCQRENSCDFYISGITQFGRGCGRPGNYGAYTNVAFYEDWIRTSLGEDASELC
nr:testisin-like isoform X2 [Ciona intestinalis]|eukprot:XP_018667230.1 testisin-like isoform X2 [Ciona intestinalis]